MTQFITYPVGGVQAYASFASLPTSAPDGTIAETLDTYNQYIYEAGSATWVLQASGGGSVSALGPVGSAPNANAGVISSGTLTLEPADGTNPGVLTAGTQTIGGAKTFSSTITAGAHSGFGAAWAGIFSSSEGPDVNFTITTDPGVGTAAMGVTGIMSGAGALTFNLRGMRSSAQRTISGNLTTDNFGLYGSTSGVSINNSTFNWTNAGAVAGLQVHQITGTGAGTITTTYSAITTDPDAQAITGRKTALNLGTQTGGTLGNASISDNTSFSGAWFINTSTANPSSFAGTITALNFISPTANPSTTGILELANGDTIGWRNAANSANQTFGLDSSNLLKLSSAGTSILAVASTLVGVPSLALQFQDTDAGNTAKNWRVGANIITNGNLDFVPSTAAAGTTFSTTALTLKTTGTLVSNSSGDVTDPAFQVLVGGSTKAGMWPSSNGCSFAYNSTEVFWYTASTISMAFPANFKYNGSASSPALFCSDASTGFYKSTTNEISFSGNSTQTLKMSSNSFTVLGKEIITGAADVVQLTITGNATQTSNVILVQNSASSALFTLNNSGNGVFTGTVTGSNLSGTNTGDVTLAAVGSTPSANGASLSGQVLTLQPADGTNPGVVTTGAQTMAGNKTFSNAVLSPIFSTNAANPASAGIIRLANATNINWRNGTNAGDIGLNVDSSNNLTYAGTAVFDSTPRLLAAAFPALTSDVTTTAGSLATTVAKIAGTTVSGTTGTTNVVFSGTPTITTPVIASITSGTGTFTHNTSGTITVPSATDTLVGLATTDTLTNKSLKDTTCTFINATTASKVLQIDLSGATASTTTTLAVSQSANRTLTLPNATDTLVGKATTDTLTNKTYNTAGTGNVFQINGTGITAVTGTGSVVLAASPTLSGGTVTYSNTGNNQLLLQSTLAGAPTQYLEFKDTDASNTQVNWILGVNFNNNGRLELIPSTAAHGTTYTNTTLGAGSDGQLYGFITNWGSSATQDVGFSVTTGAGSFQKFTSSLRYKYEVADPSFDTSKLYQMRPRQFRWKSNDSLDFGFIAEEVQAVFPEAVIYQCNEEGPVLNKEGDLVAESVRYRQLTAIIVAELKKLRLEFDAYKASHP